jgi:hypothetical protein
MDWLLGKNTNPNKYEIEIAQSIDSYCANDKDVYYLTRRVNDLQLRVEALEKTIEKINSTEYCESKLEVLDKYNLTAVKCGETTYHNHLTSPITGESMILGITPANEETPTTQNGNSHEETESNNGNTDGQTQENGHSENVLMSSQNGHENEQSVVDDKKTIKMAINLPINDLTKDFIMKATVFLSSFTIFTMFLRITLPLQQGMFYVVSTKVKSKFIRKNNNPGSFKPLPVGLGQFKNRRHSKFYLYTFDQNGFCFYFGRILLFHIQVVVPL